jgi:hypothetical protein
MTRGWIGAAAVTLVATLGTDHALAQVKLTIAEGRVTLDAKDATVRQILDEWARVGQTKFVNVERLTGAPLSLQLHDVPEATALDVLLRSASGYLLAPRPVASANLSRFDRILVMPTSTPPRPSAGPAQAPTSQPTFQPSPFPTGFPQPDSLDEEPVAGPAAVPNPRGAFPGFPGGPQPGPAGAAPARGPVFPGQSPFPVPVPGGPVQQTPPSPGSPFPPPIGFPGGVAQPGAMPTGVSVPGMVVQQPVPTQPPAQLDPQ